MAKNDKLVSQLRRVKGQVGGVEKMLSEGRGCEAVLTQIMAATSSLKSIARELLAEQALTCGESEKQREKYVTLLKRYF